MLNLRDAKPIIPKAKMANVDGSGTLVVSVVIETLSNPISNGPLLSAWANRTKTFCPCKLKSEAVIFWLKDVHDWVLLSPGFVWSALNTISLGATESKSELPSRISTRNCWLLTLLNAKVFGLENPLPKFW